MSYRQLVNVLKGREWLWGLVQSANEVACIKRDHNGSPPRRITGLLGVSGRCRSPLKGWFKWISNTSQRIAMA